MNNFQMNVENFLLHCDAKHLSRKTIRSYDQTLKLFASYLERELKITDVDKVKPLHIRTYIKYLRERGKYTFTSNTASEQINYPTRRTDYGKTISETTIANYLRNIKVFFNFLEAEEDIVKNPVSKIESIKPQRKQKILLSVDEIKKVLYSIDISTFHGLRSYVMIKLILDTGIRAGECCSMQAEDLDIKNKSILITNPKNKKQRYVYFSNIMASDLKRWLKYKDRFSDAEYLFPTIRGTMLNVNNFEASIRSIGKKVGIHFTPHQLRNNFAKYYVLNGGDWFSLSRVLGHSSVEVTQRAYLDFTDDEVKNKYQRHSPLASMKF
ncbi:MULTISPECIES: tyrosine-type recombinase/integrase [Bacillus cereus group]|uniref:tyrosine-type recombinase/integrase n=1 Tax=Bacillus cereus group TaxID=86661 RepID=UPI001F574462|nr:MULTISPECIES: tyrosine-type recombinase/integrase [unclassified Bacillus cereus group]